jgi:hypothetical protein
MSSLLSALDELASEELSETPDETLRDDVVAPRVAIDRLQAQWLRRVAELDRREAWRADGALSATSWVRWRCRLNHEEARRAVRTAHRLERLPLTAAALADGEIGYGHARSLADAATEERAEAAARSEAVLIDAARRLDVWDFTKLVARWRATVDPQGALREAGDAYAARRLYASATWGGRVVVDGELDAEGGEVVLTALDALGRPSGAGDSRTAAQRRADALVDACRLALDRGESAEVAGERPHVTVTVDLATLEQRAGAGELRFTGPICAESARRLACDAGISRVITAGDSLVIDVGRRTRIVPAALRRTLMERDRRCCFPSCDRPVTWTDAHHLVHWVDGGPTSAANLALLCRRHHRLLHEGGWEVHRRTDGELEFTPPGGRHPP